MEKHALQVSFQVWREALDVAASVAVLGQSYGAPRVTWKYILLLLRG